MESGPAPQVKNPPNDWQTVPAQDWQSVDAAPTGDTPTQKTSHPLDDLAEGVAKRLPAYSPEEFKKQFGEYDTVKNHPELARFGMNTATSTARSLASIPAAIYDWVAKSSWTPKQSADKMQENAQGGTPAPKQPPKVTQEVASDYLSGKLGGLGAGALFGEIGGVALAGAKKLPGLVRGSVDAVAGTGPGVTKALVSETQAANAADALKVANENHKAAQKHLDETQKNLTETKGRELTFAELTKQAQDLSAAQRSAQLTEHARNKAKIEADRKDAQTKFDKASAKQKKIAPLADKLKNARSSLKAAVETARENALKVGNSKYSAVNEALNNFPADMESLVNVYGEAAHSFGEAQNYPPIIKRLESAMKEQLSYKDEQLLYSELGKELSKQTLSGATYHAYDLLHETVGNDMQRIADSQGMGKPLYEARSYWRRMKQTFGKPLRVTDAASKAVGGVADEAMANEIRLLGSFDESIPQQFNHIANIEKGEGALPKPVSDRELTQKLVDARTPLPNTQDLRNKPVAKPVAPVERVSPPDRPIEQLPAPRSVNAEDVTLAKRDAIQARAQGFRNKGGGLASAVIALDVIRNAMQRTPNLRAIGADVAVRGAFEIGKRSLARVLENPKVIDFLTKANEKDLGAIPPEMRGSFPSLIKQAQAQGIIISPALLGMAAISKLPAPRAMHPTDEYQQTQP